MKHLSFIIIASAFSWAVAGMGQTLSLDSCRRMAVANNKAMAISKAKGEQAYNMRRAARTNYLPKVSVMGSYMRTGDEISLLSKHQKQTLSGLGTAMTGKFGEMAGQIVQQFPDLAPLIQQGSGYLPQIAGAVNGIGTQIVDGLRTDTRNMTAAAALLTQPLYMGGKIRAYDRITRYSEQVAQQGLRAEEQEVVLEADQAYWQVVSLSNKQRLAVSYRDIAVAKDGIQLIAKARVTVRANIRQLVGGAGEDTILARVGEGIVSSIGSSESHKQVLENPDSISKLVLKKGLDSGTAFEILSIDIADIDIGKNIGATLQMDQAQADKNIAQAKAEERRAMAIALEQEMKAKAQEARAKVIEAEAEVPRAMAEAFRSGNLGIMDYYKMKNVEADTAMRESIAKPSSKPEK